MKVEIFLPVKDEEKILATNLRRIIDFCESENFPFAWKIIGLSNGSHDRTIDILKEFKTNYQDKVDYREISIAGRGRALKQAWLNSEADAVCYLDIDLAVAPNQLPLLILPLIANEVDLVIGSRLMAGAKISRSQFRELISRAFNVLSRLILPNRATDLQCGFKAVRVEYFKIIAPLIRDNYWFFDSELVVISQHIGCRWREVPVNWNENRYEKRKSKVKIVSDIMKFIINIIKLRWRLLFLTKLK